MKAMTIATLAFAAMSTIGCAHGNQSVRTLSDASLASIVSTLNAGEIQVTEAAMPKLETQLVIDFATQMNQMHTRLNQELATLLAAQNLEPVGNEVSQALEAQAASAIAELQSLEAPVDTRYVHTQVRMHHTALALMDCVVLPNVDNSALRDAMANEARPAMQQHRARAHMLESTMSLNQPIECAQICLSEAEHGPLPDDVRNAVCE